MVQKNAGLALYLSCENGNYDVVTKMLTTVEDIDIDFQNADQDGNTPLIIAASNGHSSIVKCLLDAGANFRIENQMGYTAFQIASVNGNSTIIKALMTAQDEYNAKSKSNSPPKLPLENLNIPESTLRLGLALSSASTEPYDPSGLTLTGFPDSPTRTATVTPPVPKKKRAPSMGGSPQRKVSFAENATSSVLIIPSKEEVKMMIHKNEYNHVCSPHLSGVLESSFEGFVSTAKDANDMISKLKFRKKLKRSGHTSHGPGSHALTPAATGIQPVSILSTSPKTSPTAGASSAPGTPTVKFQEPASKSPSPTPLTIEEEEKPPERLAIMSSKMLSFKTAAQVALATVHAPRKIDVVTEEDESISMSVDLSAMGLYVSFDDFDKPVVKKVSPTSSSTSPRAIPVVSPTSNPSTPSRGLSRGSAQSIVVNLLQMVQDPSTSVKSSPASITQSTTPSVVEESPKMESTPIVKSEPEIIEKHVPTSLTTEDGPLSIIPPQISPGSEGPSMFSSPIEVAVKTEPVELPRIETVMSDEIIYSETPSTKVPFSKVSSKEQVVVDVADILEISGQQIVADIPNENFTEALTEESLQTAVSVEDKPFSNIEVNEVQTEDDSLKTVIDVEEVKEETITSQSAIETNTEATLKTEPMSTNVNTEVETTPVVISSTEIPSEIERNGEQVVVKMNNGVKLPFDTPPMVEISNSESTKSVHSDKTPLTPVVEGQSEVSTPSNSKIRDARRFAGNFGNPFSIDNLLTRLDDAQHEIEKPVVEEKKRNHSSDAPKALHLHHVADVVAEAIRQTITHPVTFDPNGGIVKQPLTAKQKMKAALSNSFTSSTTLSMADLGAMATSSAVRSVSFATGEMNSYVLGAQQAVLGEENKEAEKVEISPPAPSVELSEPIAVPTPTTPKGLTSIMEGGGLAPISEGPDGHTSSSGPPPVSPKMVTIPLVGRKQSVVHVGGRKKSLAMLLSPTVKAIGSATKAGETVESLRSKMFQEAKRRAEEYAEQQARRKEEAANLAALLKAKQEADLKRKADLKAKEDALIARRGKAKGYGFTSIKAGLRQKEFKDTQHNSPYIKMIIEKDPDDSDTDSDWEEESQSRKKSLKGAAPGVPSNISTAINSARNSAVSTAVSSARNSVATADNSTASSTPSLPSIEVSQSMNSLTPKVVPLLSIDPFTSPDKTRSRETTHSLLQANDPLSNQTQAIRKTIAMIQSDKVLENKFKWARKVSRAGSTAHIVPYHDTLKEQYEEEQNRIFNQPLPEVRKSPQKRAHTAGPTRTKPSLCVSSTQIIASHLSEAQNFCEQVSSHNQSVYIPSGMSLKPSEQALVNLKPKKQFKIVNIQGVESSTNDNNDDSKLDNSLKTMSLELEETIYNKIAENNGSLVFIDSAKDLAWHDANIDKSHLSPTQESINRTSSPQAIAAARKFYNNHQIGIGKLMNAYRPWSSPAKLHKPKTQVGFDESVTTEDEPDFMSSTHESIAAAAQISQSLPPSRNGQRGSPSFDASNIKFEGSLTMDNSVTMQRSQVSMGSMMRKRLPLMINLVKANIPRRTESEDFLSDDEEDGGEETEQ